MAIRDAEVSNVDVRRLPLCMQAISMRGDTVLALLKVGVVIGASVCS